MMMAKLRPELTQWLNDGVYPHLSHTQIFGDLVGFTVAQSGASWYAHGPRCGRKGRVYRLPGRQVGQCKSCGRTIGWFGYLRFQEHGDEDRAITRIAQLAGIDTGPDGEPRNRGISRDTLGDDKPLGLFTPSHPSDDPPS